jgi:hypothetical protein
MGKPHCGVLWMQQSHFVGKQTVVCCGCNNPTSWESTLWYVVDATIPLCGKAHCGVLWMQQSHFVGKHTMVCCGCYHPTSWESTLWCVVDGPICLLCGYTYIMFWTEQLCIVERHMMCYGTVLCGGWRCLREGTFMQQGIVLL